MKLILTQRRNKKSLKANKSRKHVVTKQERKAYIKELVK